MSLVYKEALVWKSVVWNNSLLAKFKMAAMQGQARDSWPCKSHSTSIIPMRPPPLTLLLEVLLEMLAVLVLFFFPRENLMHFIKFQLVKLCMTKQINFILVGAVKLTEFSINIQSEISFHVYTSSNNMWGMFNMNLGT
jgi:hypothetical protein